MKIEFTLDENYLPDKIRIAAEAGENKNWLHEVSRDLRIACPVGEFVEQVRLGRCNNFSDLDYEKVLSVMKRLSLLFMMGDGKTVLPSANVFDLLVVLLREYMLNHHNESSRIL